MFLSKTIEETMSSLCCGRDTVFRLIRAGTLEKAQPIYTGKAGRPETRVTTESIVRYIRGGKK